MKLNKLFAAVGINKPSQAVKAAKSTVAAVAAEAPKASAADAMENQGRAMLKKYVKPKMQEIKMENPRSLKATSGSFDHGPSEPSGGFDEGSSGSDIWHWME